MSKLALVRQYQYSPMAGGGFLKKIIKGAGKLLGIGKKTVTQIAPTILPTAKKVGQIVAPGVLAGAGWAAGEALLSPGGGGGGAAGGWGPRRRARGITARELRGYRKVANLLHKEGMVSRRARGRK